MTDRLFAIGDIHGCARELEVLLAGLPLAAGDTVACVGDYIDRGPASRQVIDLLLALRQRAGIRTVFLKGNHEDMCLSYVEQQGLWGEAWHLNGGVATLRSYGIDARSSTRVTSVGCALSPRSTALITKRSASALAPITTVRQPASK